MEGNLLPAKMLKTVRCKCAFLSSPQTGIGFKPCLQTSRPEAPARSRRAVETDPFLAWLSSREEGHFSTGGPWDSDAFWKPPGGGVVSRTSAPPPRERGLAGPKATCRAGRGREGRVAAGAGGSPEPSNDRRPEWPGPPLVKSRGCRRALHSFIHSFTGWDGLVCWDGVRGPLAVLPAAAAGRRLAPGSGWQPLDQGEHLLPHGGRGERRAHPELPLAAARRGPSGGGARRLGRARAPAGVRLGGRAGPDRLLRGLLPLAAASARWPLGARLLGPAAPAGSGRLGRAAGLLPGSGAVGAARGREGRASGAGSRRAQASATRLDHARDALVRSRQLGGRLYRAG